MPSGREIVVVGAGIVGAAISWCLARAGARVKVVESSRHAGGLATPASFAWINAANGNPKPYFDLRMRAIEDWRRWSRDMQQLDVSLSGGLSWELSGPELEAYIGEHAGWGYLIRLIERDEIRVLEPGLVYPPRYAALVEDEGSVEPAHAARTLIGLSGAEIATNTHVGGFEIESGRVTGVKTNAGILDADAVVIAAGLGTPALLACCGIEFSVDTPESLLIETEPLDHKLLSRVILTPELHIRQRSDGSLIAGADFPDDFDFTKPDGAINALVQRIQSLLGSELPISPSSLSVGRRPIPTDGFPALGPVPGLEGLYVAVTHSGVTLAPVIGDMLASLILEDETDPFLERYAFARFVGNADMAVARP